MTDVLTTFTTRGPTPQSEPIRGREAGMVKNAAGGFVFTIDPVMQVRRFLILGTDGGTYYQSARELTKDAAGSVLKLAETDHAALRATILDVSLRGAAPKQNATIFALAIACSVGEVADRNEALAMLPQVLRTGSHLFTFARYVEQFRGWGPALVRAVARWYREKDADSLAFQAIKYQQRDGVSHRDLIRLSHPARAGKAGRKAAGRETVDTSVTPAHRATFDWIHDRKAQWEGDLPQVIVGFEKAKRARLEDVADIVREFRLPWEAVPDAARKRGDVWEALLDSGQLKGTGLIRQLPTLTRLGVIGSLGAPRTAQVVAMLRDPVALKKARVHPIQMLVAQRVYARGYSERGSSTWTPVTAVIDGLNDGFYAAYGAVEPAGKNTLYAVDVSHSMTHQIADLPLTAREAAAAIALVGAATEPNHVIAGFTDGSSGGAAARGWGSSRGGALSCYQMGNRGPQAFAQLPISPKQRLDDVLTYIDSLNFGGTDCALPITEAMRVGLPIETFVILTDNESWAGPIHVVQALENYRRTTGIDARVVAVAMTATDYSVADPKDAGMLDVVGFDENVPGLISEFSRGEALRG